MLTYVVIRVRCVRPEFCACTKFPTYSPGKKSTTYSSFLGGPQAIFLGERTLNFSFHLVEMEMT